MATLTFFWFDGNNERTIGARHVNCGLEICQYASSMTHFFQDTYKYGNNLDS